MIVGKVFTGLWFLISLVLVLAYLYLGVSWVVTGMWKATAIVSLFAPILIVNFVFALSALFRKPASEGAVKDNYNPEIASIT